MDNTTVWVTQRLAGVGRPGNILKLENCMTRVCLEVSNEPRLDLTALKTATRRVELYQAGRAVPVYSRSGFSHQGGGRHERAVQRRYAERSHQ